MFVFILTPCMYASGFVWELLMPLVMRQEYVRTLDAYCGASEIWKRKGEERRMRRLAKEQRSKPLAAWATVVRYAFTQGVERCGSSRVTVGVGVAGRGWWGGGGGRKVAGSAGT
uniref:Uncharacterized protein n=1 Tax=Cucumis melo TaxID=3656 RepID=A0A9I9E737_CUCME